MFFTDGTIWLDGYILVPPKEILILDDKDSKVSTILGPAREGTQLHLTCICRGGK